MRRTLMLLVLSAAAVTACDRDGRVPLPTQPSPQPESAPTPTPPPAPAPRALRVVSGAEGLPAVNGATVHLNGQTYTTDANGGLPALSIADKPLPGAAIDVDAKGFLPRRTTIADDGLVTLWPVANGSEADAIRRMAYQHTSAGEVLLPVIPAGRYILTFGEDGREYVKAWLEEAAIFGPTFGLLYEASFTFQYESAETELLFGTPASCAIPPGQGFCREEPLDYRIFTVAHEHATSRETIRRVLVASFLGANPLPGFMNASSPASQLSPLEIQTIRMILLRPRLNRWPDTDR